jgi:hypothetical protein
MGANYEAFLAYNCIIIIPLWISTKTIFGQFSYDAATNMLKYRIYSTNCLEDQTKVSKIKP